MDQKVRLGSFVVKGLLGRGGMGRVWLATHEPSRVDVAVKVLGAAGAGDPGTLQAFDGEVRSVARLDHPGIVGVLDHGLVPAEAEAASRGQLVGGSPYLVMERASGGTLDERLRTALPTWTGARELFLTLLDALAHAHARGVIHRDVKPSNVLRCTVSDGRPGWRLSDFGIARVLDDGRVGPGSSGTPRYMAPEQVRGTLRDQGPWTDLYAFGCLAWRVLTGRAPFHDAADARQAHLVAELPDFRPTCVVPAELDGWLRTLLARDPLARFRRAADAAFALARLGGESAPAHRPAWIDPEGVTVLRPAPGEVETDALGLGGGTLIATQALLDALDDEPAPEPRRPSQRRRWARPPMPASWRVPRTPAIPARIRGAGLGLYGLRTIPLAGRVAERDVLWALLRTVERTGRAGLAVVRGASGLGKSRLAEWVLSRAHEVGAFEFLRLGGASDGGGEPLGGLVSGALALDGLSAAAARDRARRVWAARGGEEAEADRLAAIAVPSGPEAPLEARVADVRAMLVRLAAERPVAVWIDDAGASTRSLRFAARMLDADAVDPAPIAFVVAVEEGAVDRPDERALLDDLGSRPGAVALALGPLPPEDQAVLVEELLGLEGPVAARLLQRTAGNPAFAVQLVGDWVQRGLLRPTEHGFTLATAVEPPLPADLREVWDDRVRRLSEALPAGGDEALLRLAVLGARVRDAEWSALCGPAAGDVRLRVADALARRGLATPTDDDVVFAHGGLREAVLARAEPAHLVELHSACADLLAKDAARPERIGRHLRAAGRTREAFDRLCAAAAERHLGTEFQEALAIGPEIEELALLLGVPDTDPKLAGARRVACDTLQSLGRYEEALTLADAAERRAKANGNPAEQLTAWITRAVVALRRRQLAEADDLFRKALATAEGIADRDRIGAIENGLGMTALYQGRTAAAAEHLARAHAAFVALDSPYMAACVQSASAAIAHRAGDLDAAEQVVHAVLPMFERLGAQEWLGQCRNLLGEVRRARGDRAAAEEAYRAAAGHYRRAGTSRVAFPLLNLALMCFDRDAWADGLASVEQVLALPAVGEDDLVRSLAEVGVVLALAGLGRWDEWPTALDRLAADLARLDAAEADAARQLDRAAELAAAAGRGPEVDRVRALADAQWAALGGR